MKTEKLTYESPLTHPFVVRFEGRIMTGSETANAPSALPSYDQDYDDWE